MTSDQEAVCGTCGGDCTRGLIENYELRTPASVVPSDERGYEWAPPPHGKPAPLTPSQDAEDNARTRLLLRIKRMTGHEPVGMGDLLNVLTHPDCIEFTEAWLESAIREPYEALVKARGWSARVEYDGQFALVIEWPGEPPYGRYWWVLCPAAATLYDDPPSEDEDPTEHDHGACSLSPECDFNELHALAHQAIRDRAAALESLGGRST